MIYPPYCVNLVRLCPEIFHDLSLSVDVCITCFIHPIQAFAVIHSGE